MRSSDKSLSLGTLLHFWIEDKTKKIKIQFIDHLVITYSARIKIFPSMINGRCVLLKKTSAGLMNDKRWEKYSNISRNIMIIPHCLVGWRYTNTILSSYHSCWCWYIHHHSTDCRLWFRNVYRIYIFLLFKVLFTVIQFHKRNSRLLWIEKNLAKCSTKDYHKILLFELTCPE